MPIAEPASRPHSPHQDDTGVRILSAAEVRFRTYGYGKTTMAEIAEDCGMSAANIYRFFRHKQAIGVALTEKHLSGLQTRLAALADDPELTVFEKLHATVLLQLQSLHGCWREFPKFHELIDDVCRSNSQVLSRHKTVKKEMYRNLIHDGVESGAMSVDDVDAAAEGFITATLIFTLPGCMAFFELDEFERRARLVVDLLVRGMKRA